MVGAKSLSALDTNTVRMMGCGDEIIFGGCCRINTATVTQTTTNVAMVGKATRQFNRAEYAVKVSPSESDFAVRNLPATLRWKLSDA